MYFEDDVNMSQTSSVQRIQIFSVPFSKTLCKESLEEVLRNYTIKKCKNSKSSIFFWDKLIIKSFEVYLRSFSPRNFSDELKLNAGEKINFHDFL